MKALKSINKKIEEINGKWELLIIIVLAFAMTLGITMLMGTLTCGYHLVDDHEFLRWVYNMEGEGRSLGSLISEQLKADFYWRYEPAYYAGRIVSAAVFGINLLGYSLMKVFEITLSCIFLYYCAREMGGNKITSFLFSVISLMGYQSVVWWKLGPQEAQCTMWFSMGFLCMLKWLKSGKKWQAALSLIAFIIMCNYKESFILLVPFIMSYVLYYELEKRNEKLSFALIWDCIKVRLWYLLVLGVLFTAIILFIVFYVGVNNYSMVGLDATVPWEVYENALKVALSTDLKWFKRFGILFCMILLTYWEDLKKLWKEMLLTIIFLLPQFVIFGQTGIRERYILPSAIGFSFFFILVILKWKPLSGKRRAVYMMGAILLVLAHGRVALREADYFRYRGESVTTMLESVKEMSEGKINVLSCLRPNEEGNLTLNYWMLVHGYDNIYYWTEEEKLINQVCDINLTYPEERYEEQQFEDMDIVVMYNKEDRHWCYTPTLDLSDFTELKYGTLTVYVRNGSGVTPIEKEIEGLRINF